MAQKWRPQSMEVLLSWLAALQKPGVQLSDWEAHFVARLDWQVSKMGTWSQAQQTKLEEIYADRT